MAVETGAQDGATKTLSPCGPQSLWDPLTPEPQGLVLAQPLTAPLPASLLLPFNCDKIYMSNLPSWPNFKGAV